MIVKYVTNTYEITDTYKNLLINAKDASVKIEPSNDDSTKLVFSKIKNIHMNFTLKTIHLRLN